MPTKTNKNAPANKAKAKADRQRHAVLSDWAGIDAGVTDPVAASVHAKPYAGTPVPAWLDACRKDGQTRTVVIPTDYAESTRRMIQMYARDNGYTARVRAEDEKGGKVRLYFWTVDAIKRERKGK